ncbi:meteorin-like protein [Synchiropus splendidus]|uniref:meteorin-like protein n=1 Tax=Synchiropus splendidus TaxID=270530 RepID=UPI00237E12EA|nr:meteorin-like protein [Synchiropus splendidus]
MLRSLLLLWIPAALLSGAGAQYSSDQCSWRGSGLSHEAHHRDVEQVYLRCSQGSVEWLYPTGAIFINLRPNTEPSWGHSLGLHVCIRPHAHSQGANMYLEKAGELKLLLAEKEQASGSVHCFSKDDGALFVEAVPQTDISRRITAFQYELVPSQGPGVHMYTRLHSGPVACVPCSDADVLMAVCTSDFVARGSFRGVAKVTEDHSEVMVSLKQVLQQKSRIFAWGGARVRSWSGRVSLPARCHIPTGGEEFLLTGSIHFGEAWLGCAPRYKDFIKIYSSAQSEGSNPCQLHPSEELPFS